MPIMTVYSFTDIFLSLYHPDVGLFTINGTGIGSISKDMTTDRTAHDVAADGTIQISKVSGANGNLTISVQQTSPAAAFLMKWYNFITDPTTPAALFALATLEMRSLVSIDKISATGVTIQKLPTRSYQAQGGQQSWVLMCGNISDR